jgi:hypothetical protein
MRRAYFFSPFGKGRSKGGLILQPLIYSSKFKDLNGFVEASIGIEPIFTDLQGVRLVRVFNRLGGKSC